MICDLLLKIRIRAAETERDDLWWGVFELKLRYADRNGSLRRGVDGDHHHYPIPDMESDSKGAVAVNVPCKLLYMLASIIVGGVAVQGGAFCPRLQRLGGS